MTETFRFKKSGDFSMGRETENCLGQGLLLCFASVKRLKVTDHLQAAEPQVWDCFLLVKCPENWNSGSDSHFCSKRLFGVKKNLLYLNNL